MFETISIRSEELANQNIQLIAQNNELAIQNNELSTHIFCTEEFMHLMMKKMQVNPSTLVQPSSTVLA